MNLNRPDAIVGDWERGQEGIMNILRLGYDPKYVKGYYNARKQPDERRTSIRLTDHLNSPNTIVDFRLVQAVSGKGYSIDETTKSEICCVLDTMP